MYVPMEGEGTLGLLEVGKPEFQNSDLHVLFGTMIFSYQVLGNSGSYLGVSFSQHLPMYHPR